VQHVIDAIRRENDLSYRMKKKPFLAAILVLALVTGSMLGQPRSIRCRISYCTPAHIYVDAGSGEGLAIGDTLVIARNETSVGSAVITAIASHSSVCRPLVAHTPPRIGDVGTILKDVIAAVSALAPGDSATVTFSNPPAVPPAVVKLARENVLVGRVALQYTGQMAEDTRLNINQPSLVAQIRLENVAGTGMSLALRGREYYDIGGPYLRYGDSTHSRFDLSEFSIGLDQRESAFGFSAGRIIPRYVTGVGALDGGEVLVRFGSFSAGGLAGAGVQSRMPGIRGTQRIFAGFIGYHHGDSYFDSYDVSVAYARESVGGNLDRAFLSIQNSFTMGSNFSAYGNADVELKSITHGVIASHPAVSSLLVFVNYVPTPWLSTSIGYDGTRSVYLFESMKDMSDSLFHEAMHQGLRFNGTVRLGRGYTLNTEASVSSREGDGGSSHTLGAGLRITDIFSSHVFGSARYRQVGGSFLDGSQWTLTVGRYISRQLDVLLQYDVRSFQVGRSNQSYSTQTFSGTANLWISRNLFGMVAADYVVDTTMNGFRYFLECGYRF
jgi:hypothetical protein